MVVIIFPDTISHIWPGVCSFFKMDIISSQAWVDAATATVCLDIKSKKVSERSRSRWSMRSYHSAWSLCLERPCGSEESDSQAMVRQGFPPALSSQAIWAASRSQPWAHREYLQRGCNEILNLKANSTHRSTELMFAVSLYHSCAYVVLFFTLGWGQSPPPS